MNRYFLLLVTLFASIFACIALNASLHRSSATSQVPPDGKLQQTLRNTTVATDPMEMRYIASAFDALSRFDEATALRQYIAYVVLSRKLNLPVEEIGSVGAAIAWVKSDPKTVESLFQSAINDPAPAGLLHKSASQFSYQKTFQLQQYGSGHIQAIFIMDSEESAKGNKVVKESLCRDRGDCIDGLKNDISRYAGLFEFGIFIASGAFIGALLFGITSLLGVRRNAIFVMPGAGTLAGLVLVYKMGGSGYGPLAALFLAILVFAGLWIGAVLGAWVMPPKIPVPQK